MGNVLAGLVGLSRRKFWNQGQLYMEEVLDKEGDNKYSAFVYYALAHFLEVEEQEEEEAYLSFLYQITLYNFFKQYIIKFRNCL